MSMQWQPPPLPPASDRSGPKAKKSWLPAAIIGAAIVIAAGLVSGALIMRSQDGGTTTCQAWSQTRQTLRSIPALPQGWNWSTPDIDNYIRIQNEPVANALAVFEPEIADKPADVAEAAQQYVSARRKQMQSLTDRTYVPADGVAVNAALGNLDRLCGITGNG
jgi:hypothetical protein